MQVHHNFRVESLKTIKAGAVTHHSIRENIMKSSRIGTVM